MKHEFWCDLCREKTAKKQPDVQGWDGYCTNCGVVAQSDVLDADPSIGKVYVLEVCANMSEVKAVSRSLRTLKKHAEKLGVFKERVKPDELWKHHDSHKPYWTLSFFREKDGYLLITEHNLVEDAPVAAEQLAEAIKGTGQEGLTMTTTELTPLQRDELKAMTGDRIAILRVVSALRKYRAAVEALLKARNANSECDAETLWLFKDEIDDIEKSQ